MSYEETGSRTRSSAKIMAALAAIYIFCTAGGLSAYVVPYGFLPEYIGTTTVKVSFAVSLYSVAGAMFSLVAAPMFNRLGIKKCMLIGSTAYILFGLLIAFVPNLASLYIAFFLGGMMIAVGGYSCVSALMTAWFGKKSPTYISLCVGVGCIGAGLLTGTAGVLFEHFGTPAVFLQCAATGVVALIVALFVKDSPEKAGEQSLYTEDEEAETTVVEAEHKAGGAMSVYRNPVAWLFLLATFLVRFMIMPIGLYTTVYFADYGMSVSGASLVVTWCGLAAGFFNLFGGKLLERIGVKPYILLVLAGIVGIYLFTWLYASMPYLWIVVLMIVCSAFGGTCTNMSVIISPKLFDIRDSIEISTKSVGVNYLGNIICPVLIAWAFTYGGYNWAWGVAIVAAILSLIIYTVIFMCLKSKEAKTAH